MSFIEGTQQVMNEQLETMKLTECVKVDNRGASTPQKCKKETH